MGKIKNTKQYNLVFPSFDDYVIGTKKDNFGKTVNFSVLDIAALATNLQANMIISVAEMKTEDNKIKIFNSDQTPSKWRLNSINREDVIYREFNIDNATEGYFRVDLLLIGTNPNNPFVYVKGEENAANYIEPSFDGVNYLRVTPIYVNGGVISEPQPPIGITLPTKTSDLENDGEGSSKFATMEDLPDVSNKLDKVSIPTSGLQFYAKDTLGQQVMYNLKDIKGSYELPMAASNVLGGIKANSVVDAVLYETEVRINPENGKLYVPKMIVPEIKRGLSGEVVLSKDLDRNILRIEGTVNLVLPRGLGSNFTHCGIVVSSGQCSITYVTGVTLETHYTYTFQAGEALWLYKVNKTEDRFGIV